MGQLVQKLKGTYTYTHRQHEELMILFLPLKTGKNGITMHTLEND